MLSFPIHQPSFAPENVPDLDYIKDQRKQLAVELGVDLSHLDEVFDRGAENFSRICREVEALLKEKDIVNIASLRKFFNQTDFVQKIGCIFTNREGGDSLDMS
jgi:pantothenate synthetase